MKLNVVANQIKHLKQTYPKSLKKKTGVARTDVN